MKKIKTCVKNFKASFKRFLKDESGMEFLQLAIVIAIVAVMAIVIWGIAASSTKKLEEAQSELDKIQITKP